MPPLASPVWDLERARHLLSTRGPGYTSFLAGMFRLFGLDPWPVRIAQALLGACLCVLLSQIGRDLGGRSVGLVAGLLAALHPSLVLFSGRILSESVAGFELVLGLALLLGGIRRRRADGLGAAGLAFAAAALTRPPLLALLPLLPVAAAAALGEVGARRRALLVGAFTATLFVPVAGFNLWLRATGTSPIAGAQGLAFLTDVTRTATLPELRGWRPDSFPPFLWEERSGDWGSVLAGRPLYPVMAAANLVFQHLWFLDDLWREVPGWLHGYQRAVTLLALGGLGLAVPRWRTTAPLLAALAPAALVWVSWIEPRHSLPFVPLLILLASLFAVQLAHWSRPRTRASLVAGALLATGALLWVTRLPRLAALLPGVDPLALGAAADATVLVLVLLWGALVSHLAADSLGRTRAAFAGIAPAVVFALLFAAHVSVASSPRWRAWSVDLAASPRSAVQTLELDAPLAAGEIASLAWLVDLATAQDPPPLRVGLDGTWLAPAAYEWQRLFCHPEPLVVAAAPPGWRRPHRELPLSDERLSGIWCRVYRDGIDRFTAALAASPQWWALRMEPGLAAGRRTLSLWLAAADPAAGPVRLGGVYARGGAPRFSGPSLAGLTPGPGTSLTRWHVLHDWRFWEEGPLAGASSASRLVEPPALPGDRALASAMARGEAHLGIRLVVDLRDGSRRIY